MIVGLVGLASVVYGASLVEAAPPVAAEQEKEVEVTLVEMPEEPKDEPPPPAPEPEEPAPALTQAKAAPAPGPAPAPAPDTTSADSDPFAAADAPANSKPGGTGNGTGNGTGTGTGSGTGTAFVPPPPPPTPPPPPPPPNPADYAPPKCKQRGIDAAQAKAIGVEGRVVVKYTVTASGAVINVRAESGPAELRALAVAAVSSWTCEPARMKSDGSALQVTKNVPLTVRLKTD